MNDDQFFVNGNVKHKTSFNEQHEIVKIEDFFNNKVRKHLCEFVDGLRFKEYYWNKENELELECEYINGEKKITIEYKNNIKISETFHKHEQEKPARITYYSNGIIEHETFYSSDRDKPLGIAYYDNGKIHYQKYLHKIIHFYPDGRLKINHLFKTHDQPKSKMMIKCNNYHSLQTFYDVNEIIVTQHVKCKKCDLLFKYYDDESDKSCENMKNETYKELYTNGKVKYNNHHEIKEEYDENCILINYSDKFNTSQRVNTDIYKITFDDGNKKMIGYTSKSKSFDFNNLIVYKNEPLLIEYLASLLFKITTKKDEIIVENYYTNNVITQTKTINGRYHQIEESDKISYYYDGLLHRENEPAVIECILNKKSKLWYLNGILQKELCYDEDKLITEELITSDGYEKNFYNDSSYKKIYFNKERKVHRNDEPAIIHIDGNKEWYINGKQVRVEKYTNGKLTHLMYKENTLTFVIADNKKVIFTDGILNYLDDDKPCVTIFKDDKIIQEQWFINHNFGRIDDKPCIIDYDDNNKIIKKQWYLNRNRHRIDGFAIEEYKDDLFIKGIHYRKGFKYAEIIGLTNINTEQCPICLTVPEYISMTITCHHKYCKECIELWTREINTCPYCRQEL